MIYAYTSPKNLIVDVPGFNVRLVVLIVKEKPPLKTFISLAPSVSVRMLELLELNLRQETFLLFVFKLP